MGRFLRPGLRYSQAHPAGEQPTLGGVRAARTPQPGVGTDDDLVFQIEIPIVDHRTCQEAYAPLKKKVTRDMICAGFKEGKSRNWYIIILYLAHALKWCRAQEWKGWTPWSLVS